jgi:hypothetical protein
MPTFNKNPRLTTLPPNLPPLSGGKTDDEMLLAAILKLFIPAPTPTPKLRDKRLRLT